jgi:sec-independent protein translocase protein TatB
MFDLGWGKLLLIGIVALVVIGPKELPGALRTLGQWMTKIRRMASEFQNQFHEAMREAELADLKKDVDEMAATAQSYANINPMDDLRKDIESAITPPSEFDSSLSKLSSTASTTSDDTLTDTAASAPSHDAATNTPAAMPPAASPPAASPPAASPPAVTQADAESPAPSAPAAPPASAGTSTNTGSSSTAGAPTSAGNPDPGRAA